ncbi:alpha/beta fold hydrolase [Nonomuraea mangrovi]|uniref:Alpha/beta fold hydrolase n=1 Tax=Nonomuraea mangrovi TaxID=2316207 RepID=A0ABW4SKI8_9ACTN
MSEPIRPTIVLVHGAFTDASSWAAVIGELQAAGFTVRAPANPLRDLAGDAAHISGVVRAIDGPVVLVGHCYGGAVITNVDAGNVVALGFVAAFGLDSGESVRDLVHRFAPMPIAAATVRAEGELYVRDDRFREVLAADLPPHVTAVMSAAQRPIARGALEGRSGRPSWASLPTWYAIAHADRALNPRAQHFMAQRMAAVEHHLDGSHAVPLSLPAAVADMIRAAAGR